MGTRSLTKFYDVHNENPFTCIYRQYDGYIESGHGKELAEFLATLTMCNGIPCGKPEPDVHYANGMGCLAAQVVVKLKDQPGVIYIESPNSTDEMYNYHVQWNGTGGPAGDVLTLIIRDFNDKLIWKGTPNELMSKINAGELIEEEEVE